MDDSDIFEMPKNVRIRIDHYSWPAFSPYRVFDKEDFNRRCIEEMEEFSKSRDYIRLAAVRSMILRLHIDPHDLPSHPSWDDEEFERVTLEALFEIIGTDSNIMRSEALKLARSRSRTKNIKRKEIYDRIIFELKEAREDEFEALVEEVHGEPK